MSEITIERGIHGQYVIRCGSCRESYWGYPKREAVRRFRHEFGLVGKRCGVIDLTKRRLDSTVGSSAWHEEDGGRYYWVEFRDRLGGPWMAELELEPDDGSWWVAVFNANDRPFGTHASSLASAEDLALGVIYNTFGVSL